MLVVFVLKLKYKYKARALDVEGEYDHELCYIKKVTSLEFNNEYNEWYLLPTITISFNCGVDITFHWLKIYYSSYWSVVTFKDEDKYAEFIRYKNNKNES